MTYEQRIQELLSVELLSEVLESNVDDFEVFDNYIYINSTDMVSNFATTNNKYEDKISIDAFCFKCTEWALGENYYIEVGVHPTANKTREYFCTAKNQNLYSKIAYNKNMATSQECILDATLWVMDNK